MAGTVAPIDMLYDSAPVLHEDVMKAFCRLLPWAFSSYLDLKCISLQMIYIWRHYIIEH